MLVGWRWAAGSSRKKWLTRADPPIGAMRAWHALVSSLVAFLCSVVPDQHLFTTTMLFAAHLRVAVFNSAFSLHVCMLLWSVGCGDLEGP